LPGIDVPQLFIAFSVLLLSLTVHEAAHAWTADTLGDSTARRLGRVSLNPFVHADPIGTFLFPLLAMVGNVPLIGWAKPVPVDLRQLRNGRRGFVLVAAAGPASNLVLAVAASLVLALIPAEAALADMGIAPPVAAFLSRAVQLNLLLAVFNMLPIPPLDGGNVLSGLLPPALAHVFDLIRPYGFLLLYALLLTGGFQHLVGPPYAFLRSWLP
jgi:Zn-dependent protease